MDGDSDEALIASLAPYADAVDQLAAAEVEESAFLTRYIAPSDTNR